MLWRRWFGRLEDEKTVMVRMGERGSPLRRRGVRRSDARGS